MTVVQEQFGHKLNGKVAGFEETFESKGDVILRADTISGFTWSEMDGIFEKSILSGEF